MLFFFSSLKTYYPHYSWGPAYPVVLTFHICEVGRQEEHRLWCKTDLPEILALPLLALRLGQATQCSGQSSRLQSCCEGYTEWPAHTPPSWADSRELVSVLLVTEHGCCKAVVESYGPLKAPLYPSRVAIFAQHQLNHQLNVISGLKRLKSDSLFKYHRRSFSLYCWIWLFKNKSLSLIFNSSLNCIPPK